MDLSLLFGEGRASDVAAQAFDVLALFGFAGDARDLENTDTVYEGIVMETLTYTASYYFMRNVKGIMELNADRQDKVDQSGACYTGHLSNENYLLPGFDAAC